MRKRVWNDCCWAHGYGFREGYAADAGGAEPVREFAWDTQRMPVRHSRFDAGQAKPVRCRSGKAGALWREAPMRVS